MKIVLVGLTFPYRGGISHFTTALCRHLRRRNEVRLVSFSRLYPAPFFPGKTQFDTAESSFKAVPDGKIDTLNPLTWARAHSSIEEFRPDLIVFMWWSPATAPGYFFIAKMLKSAFAGKIVFYCHNVFPHENHWLAARLSRLALGTADLFLTHAENDAQTLARYFPRIPATKTFHPPYDIFPKKGMSRENARDLLGIHSDIILFFGHIREYKGLETLIRAMPAVLARRNCALLVAGEFYEPRERYARIVEETGLKGRIVIHDRYIPNDAVEAYFAAADVVALPYRSASQSGVAQLAYHFDRPVVSTRVGGLAEAVEHGRTGYLAPPDQPEVLANTLLEFYAAKGTVDFAANIQSRKMRFSWERLAEMIETVARQNREKPDGGS